MGPKLRKVNTAFFRQIGSGVLSNYLHPLTKASDNNRWKIRNSVPILLRTTGTASASASASAKS